MARQIIWVVLFTFGTIFINLTSAHAEAASCQVLNLGSQANIILSKGCYELNQNLTVAPTQNLTISPGVSLYADNPQTLVIQGNIFANRETAEESIIFDNIDLALNTLSPTPQKIKGLELEGNLAVLQGKVDLSFSQIFGSVTFSSPQPQIINNNTIRAVQSHAIFLDHSEAAISQNTLESAQNALRAISSKLTLENNRLMAAQKGLEISECPDAIIDSNHIFHTQTAVSIQNSPNFTFSQNSLYDNTFGVVLDNSAPQSFIYNDFYPITSPLLKNNPLVKIINPPAAPLDLRQNWWGDATGAKNPVNPTGLGGIVEGQAIISPWLKGFTNLELTTNQLIISEIFAYPEVSTDEWLEIYNTLDKPLYLRNLLVADKSSNDAVNIYLPAKGYGLIRASAGQAITNCAEDNCPYPTDHKIGSGLNNSGDEITLTYQDIVIQQITYPSFKKNQSYAYVNGIWYWLTSPSPLEENTAPPEDPPEDNNPAPASDVEDYSSCPVINASQIVNYLGQCVIIRGNVKDPQGSSFYLKDATGEIRIYLQAKRQIKKPRLKQGDFIEVRGVIDFYRGAWRLLPLITGDIKLLYHQSDSSDDEDDTKSLPSKIKDALVPKVKAASPNTNNLAPPQKGSFSSSGNQVKGQKNAQTLTNLRTVLYGILLLSVLCLGFVLVYNRRKDENTKPQS